MKELEMTQISKVIQQINRGDFDSFSIILDHYQHMAYTIAYRICKNKEDAEDVTQDAFVKAFRNISSFSRKSKFSSWLYRIVFTTAISKTKSFHSEICDIEKNESVINDINFRNYEALERISRSDQINFVHKAINQLRPNETLVITLFYIAEKSIEEISIITNCTKNTVKVQLHRARKSLEIEIRKLLGEEVRELYLKS